MDYPSSSLFELNPHLALPWHSLGVTIRPKMCWRRLSSRATARPPWLNDVRPEKAFRQMIHRIFMRAAVWVVNDVRFYYYIWNVSRLTCMLKHLLISQGSLHYPSLPACCVNISCCIKGTNTSALKLMQINEALPPVLGCPVYRPSKWRTFNNQSYSS